MYLDLPRMIVPVFTPTNHGAIVPYVAHLVRHRLVTIVVGGTTGEGMALSVQERKTLLEAWIAAAKPAGIKVIAQVGGAPLPDVKELAKHAEEMKVDAIMTLPELYYKPKTVDHLLSYLDRVSKAAPTLPLIYYHFPMMTGVDVNIRQLFTAASTKVPNLIGAKADLSVADQVDDLMGGDYKIFIANHQVAPSVLMGHDSNIATVSNIFPDLVSNIIAAVKDGEVDKAKILQKRLNKLVDAIASQGDFVPAMKYAMEIMSNIDLGPVRPPLTPLSTEQKMKIKENLQALEMQV